MLGLALASGALMVGAAPAIAQEGTADIDAMIDATASPAGALRLAHSQAEQGDLTAAAATLERALLGSAANDASVRLYYVTLLCRLDDRERARIEALHADARSAPAGAVEEARAACGTLDLPGGGAANGGVVGNLAIGFGYDSNTSAALSPVFALPGVAVPSRDGLSVTASAQVDGRYPVGGGYLYGGLAAATRNSVSGPRLDYQLGSARAGFGMQGPGVGFELGALLRHGRLLGNPFYSEYGGQAEVSTAAGANGRIALRGEVVHQDYVGSLPTLDRDGTRYDAALEYRATLEHANGWVAGAAYENKSARTRNLGYEGWRLYAAARLPISQAGTYTALSATVRHINYRDVTTVVDRIETRWFARAALGTPIGGSPVDVEGAVSYTHRDYNSASGLRNYNSFGAELRLVLNFGR